MKVLKTIDTKDCKLGPLASTFHKVRNGTSPDPVLPTLVAIGAMTGLSWPALLSEKGISIEGSGRGQRLEPLKVLLKELILEEPELSKKSANTLHHMAPIVTKLAKAVDRGIPEKEDASQKLENNGNANQLKHFADLMGILINKPKISESDTIGKELELALDLKGRSYYGNKMNDTLRCLMSYAFQLESPTLGLMLPHAPNFQNSIEAQAEQYEENYGSHALIEKYQECQLIHPFDLGPIISVHAKIHGKTISRALRRHIDVESPRLKLSLLEGEIFEKSPFLTHCCFEAALVFEIISRIDSLFTKATLPLGPPIQIWNETTSAANYLAKILRIRELA